MKINPNEILIHGEAHLHCDEHDLYFRAFFGTEKCPMCKEADDKSERIEELEADLEYKTQEFNTCDDELSEVTSRLEDSILLAEDLEKRNDKLDNLNDELVDQARELEDKIEELEDRIFNG